MTKVYLIRHGITDWMEKEILHGVSDRPLSAFGLQQADATAEFLKDVKFDRIYTSPLQRAAQTAEKIGASVGITPIPVEGLMEENYGILEGGRDWWPTVKTKPLIIPFYSYTRVAISTLTGEPFWAFRNRVVRTWETIKSDNPSGTIGVVAHSGVLRHILRHEFGGPRTSKKYTLTTASVSEIEVDGRGNARIIQINQNAHLPGDKFI
jgi:broad specificity phosphatase PhoE